MFSFDFAQQVQYPSNPDQPSAIFFKAPRKCALFGICNEAINRQTTYVIDEAVDCGKGANNVISYLHHYLSNYGIGEKFLFLQADNCSGQNKNNMMMQYLSWRVSQGLHTKILINFMIAGHTKFAPDRCFGLIKQNYRRHFVSSLFDVADVINSSSAGGTNISQLVGLPSGEVVVKVFNWQKFFAASYFRIPNIKSYHHFRFDRDHPTKVFAKEFVGAPEKEIQHAKSNQIISGDPEEIIPKGFSQERKKYLYKEIRQFCRPGTENLVAPYAT